jgi:hypothetical protein
LATLDGATRNRNNPIYVVPIKVAKAVQSSDCRMSLLLMVSPRNTKGESITVPLTSCLTGLESAV